MNGINLMVEEHKYIKRMLGVMRKYCYKVMNKEEVDYSDFYKMIDFVRNYADKHHHGKEEALLFKKMTDELGQVADKLIRFGMLVEHDLGRLYMQELENAIPRYKEGDDEARLDIIANAIGYTHLLTRHIDKEDNVVYTFAEKNLNEDTLNFLDKEIENFEVQASNDAVQEKYLTLLTELESKV